MASAEPVVRGVASDSIPPRDVLLSGSIGRAALMRVSRPMARFRARIFEPGRTHAVMKCSLAPFDFECMNQAPDGTLVVRPGLLVQFGSEHGAETERASEGQGTV